MLTWIRTQWKLCVGFLVGIFSFFLFTRNKNDTAQLLADKRDAERKIAEAEKEVERKREISLRKNLDVFFEKNEEIDLNLKRRLEEIEENKKKRVNEILESDDPTELIARKLKEFLDN